jgi:hypothetical protein
VAYFFFPERKPQREHWVVDAFLKNLAVAFSPFELITEPDQPPDIRILRATGRAEAASCFPSISAARRDV